MKKLLNLFVFIIAFFTLSSTKAFAASPTATLVASSSSINAGNTVTIQVKVSNCSSTSLGIIPTYDANTFELVSGKWNISGAAMSDFSDGCAVIAYTDKYTFNGNVFEFVLKAKSSAKLNKYSVSCEVQAEGYSVVNASTSISIVCNHSYGSWTKVDSSNHTRKCSKCGAVENKAHTFDNSCDSSCNDCGYTRTTTHSYSSSWASDGSQHWHACTVCGAKKDASTHTPDKTLTTNANGHGYKCTVCGQLANVESHVFDNACDTSCNVCGYTRTTEHKYSTTYKSDSSGHWYECSGCGAKKSFAAHTPGAEATESAPQTCTICAYVIKPAKAHEHVYSGDFQSDSSEHWQLCVCGQESEHETHNFDAGSIVVEPLDNKSGTKVYRCQTCDFEKMVEIEYINNSDNSGVDSKTSAKNSNNGAKETGINYFKILGGFLVGMGFSSLIWVLVDKISSKKNTY